ncbi:hypothetical protein [Absidia glauca]|uniref:Retrotransposon gag domain-containing protein n=1 Tax=Absidia glauca TaxID=4829 RepID=A0A168M331_ABSGL|nr:hypothetical protein [Absidia glauca]
MNNNDQAMEELPIQPEVNWEGAFANDESSVQSTGGTDQELHTSLDLSLQLAKQHLKRTEDQFQQFIIHGAEDQDFTRNERIRDMLKKRINDIEAEKEARKKKPLTLPRNLPVLQLVGDQDVIKAKTTFETIDKFVFLFQMIARQHGIDLDDHWEPCMISAIQHSVDKAMWFQDSLMGRALVWEQVKQIIKDKYSGDRVQTHYPQQLVQMKASRHESPVGFVDKFASTLRSTGSDDSAGYGSILLKALSYNHASFVRQVRLAYAAAPTKNRPAMDVAYVVNVAPILCEEEEMDKQVSTNRKDSTSFKNHGGKRRHREESKGPTKKVRFDTKAKIIKPKEKECYSYGKPWDPTHRCAEYLKKKASHFAARMASLKIDDLEIGSHDDDNVAMSDLECKSVGTKRKAVDGTKSSFIVPLTLEKEKIYALVDTGCTFSSIDKFFVNKKVWSLRRKEEQLP